MRTGFRASFVILAAVTALISVQACKQSASEAPARSAAQEIRIAGHTTQLGAALKIAEAKGFYRKHGLHASVQLVESSKESMAAMEAGQFDVVIGSLAAGSFNLLGNGDINIIADGGRVVPSVVVRKDLWDAGAIRRIEDLKGREIMTPRQGSASYYALARILARLQLTINDIKPRYLEDNAALAALEAKQIDAAVLNEPHATNAVQRGLGERFSVAEIGAFFPPEGQQHMVLFAKTETVAKRRAVLTKFLAAYLDAVMFYEDARRGVQPQRAETVRIIAAYTHADTSVIESAVWPRVSRDGKPDIAYIQQMRDYFVQNGLVDRPIDLNQVVRMDLLPASR